MGSSRQLCCLQSQMAGQDAARPAAPAAHCSSQRRPLLSCLDPCSSEVSFPAITHEEVSKHPGALVQGTWGCKQRTFKNISWALQPYPLLTQSFSKYTSMHRGGKGLSSQITEGKQWGSETSLCMLILVSVDIKDIRYYSIAIYLMQIFMCLLFWIGIQRVAHNTFTLPAAMFSSPQAAVWNNILNTKTLDLMTSPGHEREMLTQRMISPPPPIWDKRWMRIWEGSFRTNFALCQDYHFSCYAWVLKQMYWEQNAHLLSHSPPCLSVSPPSTSSLWAVAVRTQRF